MDYEVTLNIHQPNTDRFNQNKHLLCYDYAEDHAGMTGASQTMMPCREVCIIPTDEESFENIQ